jgi:hypothetical protein
MRRRIYYVMPTLESARKIMDDLLLARIEERHIHFIARRGTPMDGLHEANVLQKTDIVHGAQLGMIVGAALGCIAGVILVFYPPVEGMSKVLAVVIASAAGAVFGMWASSMAAASIPNTHLRKYEADIEAGKILLMVDVPHHKVDQIHDLLAKIHPEAAGGDIDPVIPAFP